MNNRISAYSITNSLSLTLALASFVGLVCLSSIVYFAISNHLHSKQENSLLEKQKLLVHIIEEAGDKIAWSEVQHRLDDFFSGHRYLILQLMDSSGNPIYSSSGFENIQRPFQRIEFPLNPVPSNPSITNAQLLYDSSEDHDLLVRLAWILAAVTLFGSVGIAAMSRALVKLGMTPMTYLADQIASMDLNSGLIKIDVASQPKELSAVVIQFNELLDRLERSYQQLDNFNADVAHELNTPLTTLITSNELALMDNRHEGQFKEHVGGNLEELHRISEIIKDMLFVASSERGVPARRTYIECLSVVAREVVEYHQYEFEDRGLALLVTGDASGEIDVPLIKRALSNLVGNAARYAQKNSTVEIVLESVDGSIFISVTNIGEALESDKMKLMFDRFYRVDSARSDSMSHHGLGLAIVAGIARMHFGETFVRSQLGKNTFGFRILQTALE